MATTAPTPLPVIHPDTLSFVGLERSHLRSAVYRRVFGDDTGPVRIGRYSLLERVGAGARGVVFKAFDNQLDRLVALKVLSTRADDHEELIREAKALARLSHPNVLPVYEVGETEDGQVFLATEYVKGWTLRGWYDEETRGEAAIVEVIRQVAQGVQAAHDEGLVHRDLKPANILLGEDGRVRVADFGLARFDPSALEPSARVPRDGVATTTAGTPGYMAPELFQGSPASTASDQYALAVTLHELLTGSAPGERAGAVRGVSKSLVAVTRRGLCDAPEDRFATVGAFGDALTLRSKASWRRKAPWVVGAAIIGSVAATAFLSRPQGERPADNELALLRAKAKLPANPSAAIEELRAAPDPADPRLLPTTELALALGPEQTRYALPEGAHDITLLGDLLTFWTTDNELEARRLGTGSVATVSPADFGLDGIPPDKNVVLMLDQGPWTLGTPDPAALAKASPWAARAYAGQHTARSYSQDGGRIAKFANEPQELLVEDTATDTVLWRHGLSEGRFRSATMAQDGERVAWVDGNGAAFVLGLSTGVLQELAPAASKVWFEPHRNSVIVRGQFSGLFEVDLATGESTRLLNEGLTFARVEISPGGEWIAAQGPNQEISVTNLIASVPRTIRGESFEFSPDGHRLATRDGGVLTVHDLSSGERYTVTAPGEALKFSFTDANTLWTVGPDNKLRSFDIPTTTALRGHTGPVRSIELSEDGSFAVSSARDYTIRTWDVAAGAGRLLANLDYVPSHLCLDEASNQVVMTRYRAPSLVLDLDTGERIGEAPQSNARPVFGPGNAIFGAGKGGVWSYKDGAVTVIADDVGACSAIAATPEWVGAVCKGDDLRVHVWRGDDHDSAPSEGSGGFGSSLHAWPDANHLYFLGNREELIRITADGLERLESPHRLGTVHLSYVPAYSNRSHDLVVSTSDGIQALWSPTSSPVEIAGEESSLALALSGDGRHAAYANDQHQIIIRERPLSKARPSLSAALESGTPEEGSL